MVRSSVLVLSVLCTSVAFAGGDHTCQGGHNCNTTDSATGAQSQSQHQSQSSYADADANSKSSSDSKSSSNSNGLGVGYGGAGGSSNSSGTGVGVGGDSTALSGSGANSGGNTTEFTNHSLSMSLPGYAGAASVGDCHESNGSKGAFGIGVGGKTRINKACADRQQCLALADRLAAWGQLPMAVAQLQTCGGVEGSAVTAPTAKQDYATKEDLNRAFEAAHKK